MNFMICLDEKTPLAIAEDKHYDIVKNRINKLRIMNIFTPDSDTLFK